MRRIYFFGNSGASEELEPILRRQPAMEPTVHSQVLVPLLQALCVGLLLSTSVAVVYAVMAGGMWTAKMPTMAAIVLGLTPIVTTVVFITLLGRYLELLWRVEEFLGHDLNSDGYVGEPERIRVEIAEKPGHIRFLDLPLSEDRMKRMARLALAGRLGVRDMRTVMTDTEWAAVRDELLKAGLVRWKGRDSRAGLELTEKGRQVMEKLAYE